MMRGHLTSKEHTARVLGYNDRLANQNFVIPAEWSDAERKAYQDGVIAAERALGLEPADQRAIRRTA